MTDKQMSEGQLAYEQRRAAKAGKSLDTWLEGKRKADAEQAKAAAPAKPRKPNLLSRLIDRAHQPLKK